MLPAMATVDRTFDRGTRRGERWIRLLGEEFREQRLALGLSQQRVADAARMSRSRHSRIESGKVLGLSILDTSRIASVLGLDLSVRLYPGGRPIRDAAHAQRLQRVLGHVRPPLRYRVEVPLPRRDDQVGEWRGWDAMLYGGDRRTGIELEMRLRDVQATIRRHGMKRRDDPVDSFLLVLADTPMNRRVISENALLWPALPRLKTARVLAALRAGEHPPVGIIFI